LEEGTDCRENDGIHCCPFGRVWRLWKRSNGFSMDGLELNDGREESLNREGKGKRMLLKADGRNVKLVNLSYKSHHLCLGKHLNRRMANKLGN
jgi:hypothetical protein